MEGLITPVETIDADEMLSKGLKKLEDSEVIAVTRAGKYAGELRPDMLLRFKGDADTIKVGRVARRASVISEKDAAKFDLLFSKFSRSGQRSVIITDKAGRPSGIALAKNVLMIAAEALKGTKASDVLEKVLVADGSMPADKAEEMMVRNGAKEIAVLEEGKFSGILSARDIAVKIKPYLHQKLHDKGRREKVNLERVPIRSVLTPEFEIRKVGPGKSAFDALTEAEFEEAYVFDGQKLMGKVSYFKLLKGLELEEPAHIEISGLGPEEAMFKESIFEECAKILRKFGKGGSLHLRIKSSRKGKSRKIFEVHGRMEIAGRA
ncbi:MAG: CBS domain-containing protein, partial [Candidatus Micrarchaeota archaeon]